MSFGGEPGMSQGEIKLPAKIEGQNVVPGAMSEVVHKSAADIEIMEAPLETREFTELREKTGFSVRYAQESTGDIFVSLIGHPLRGEADKGLPDNVNMDTRSVPFDADEKELAGKFYDRVCEALKRYAAGDESAMIAVQKLLESSAETIN